MNDVPINPLTTLPVENSQLEEITKLAEQQVKLEQQLAWSEEAIEKIKEQLHTLSEITLPGAMQAVGMESFKLKDGTAVKVSKYYSASIPKDPVIQVRAFKWFRDNNFSEMIKRKVEVSFGKGEDATANLAVQALKAMNLEPIDKESVHPQTLKAFVKEEIEAGHNLPMDLLGVYIGNRTKITPAKQ